MAYTFDGSSQSVQLGAAGINIGTTRPITSAVLLDSANLRTSGSWQTVLGNGSDGTNKGWFWRITTSGTINIKYYVTGPTGVEFTTSGTIGPNTGIWLAVVVIRTSGANTIINVYFYSYRTRLWTHNQSGNLSNTAMIAPGAGDVTMLAAGNNFADYVPSAIGWAGVWNADFSNGGMARSPQVAALIERGGWALLDPTCTLFVPLTPSLRDLAAPGRVITPLNTPTPAVTMLTEAPPIPTLWFADVVAAGGAGIPVLNAATLTYVRM